MLWKQDLRTFPAPQHRTYKKCLHCRILFRICHLHKTLLSFFAERFVRCPDISPFQISFCFSVSYQINIHIISFPFSVCCPLLTVMHTMHRNARFFCAPLPSARMLHHLIFVPIPQTTRYTASAQEAISVQTRPVVSR